MFDKDNTLTDHDGYQVRQDLLPYFEQAIATFGDDNVAVLSNNKQSSLGHRVTLLKGGPLSKPFGAEQVAKSLGVEGSRVAVIGDRLATDVTLGHLLGGVSLLVLPWCTDNEQLGLAAARRLENFAWRHLLGQRLAPHKNEVIKKLQVSARFP